MERIANIIAGITTLAIITTLVSHRNTATIISAVGNAYSRSLRAAMGK